MLRNIRTTTLRADNIKYVSKNVSLMSVGHTLGILLSLASAYFFANYLEKDIYGSYQFVLTIGSIMSIFTLRGVEKQIIRTYAKHHEDTLVNRTYQFFILSLPVALAGICVGYYFELKGNSTLFWCISLLSVTFPLIQSFSLFNASHLAREQFGIGTVKGVIQTAIPTMNLVFAILVNANLLTLIATFCFSQLVTTAALFAHTVYSTKLNLKVKKLKLGSELHISISQSILDISKLADRMIVFSFFGASSLASYMIALLPVRESLRLNTMLRALIIPKFAKQNFRAVHVKLFEKTLILFIALSLIAITYSHVSPIVFGLIFPNYSESVQFSQLLIWLLPLNCSFVLVEGLTIFDKTKELYLANIIMSVVSITSLVIGSLFLGILGVVFAKIIAATVYLMTLIYLMSQTKLS